ncbi:MAG: signal peptidase I [Oscillospiraceae bacterium]|nr:signal peptidase I [Oscillospiraceae bacterium]
MKGEAGVTETEADEDKPFSNAVDWVCTIVFTAVAVILINLFLFRAISVDGTSMCDTLQDNDVVITTNFFYAPNFGDIVVIRTDKLVNSDTGLYGEPIIKRVIGVAGDTIRFDLEKGEVYRNGELLTEDYIIGPTNQKYGDWVETDTDYVVPENCVFVLGDNRKVSHDSRDLRLVGFVDENYIMGKAIFRIFPLGGMKWL